MEKQVINMIMNFVSEQNPNPDVDVTYVSAQTGDILMMFIALLAGILLACGVIYCFLKLRKKNTVASHANTSASAKYNLGVSFETTRSKVLLCIIVSIVAMILCFSFSRGALATTPNTEVSGNLEYTNVINAYVNEDTGVVRFDSGFLKNVSDRDVVKISGFNAEKCEGVDDGNCNWKINLNGTELLNDSLEEPFKKSIQPPFVLDVGEEADMTFESDITTDIAKQLSGQQVLQLSFEFVETEFNLQFSSNGPGSVSPTLIHVGSKATYYRDEDNNIIVKDEIDEGVYETYSVKPTPDAQKGAYFVSWTPSDLPIIESRITKDMSFTCKFDNVYNVVVDLEQGTTNLPPDSVWTHDSTACTYTRSCEYGTLINDIKNSFVKQNQEFYKEWGFATEIDWGQQEKLTKDLRVKPIWQDNVNVVVDLDGGDIATGSTPPSGWAYDEATNTYTKNFTLGSQITIDSIKSEWNNVKFTRETDQKYADSLTWPKDITHLRKPTTVKPNWGDTALVKVSLDGGKKISEGDLPDWPFDPENLVYSHRFPVGTPFTEIAKDWKTLVLEKTTEDGQVKKSNEFNWPDGNLVSDIDVAPVWANYYWVTVYFDGGLLEESKVPTGWDKIWSVPAPEEEKPVLLGAQKLMKENTPKSGIVADWKDVATQPHKFAYNFYQWSWDETIEDTYKLNADKTFSAIYEKMQQIPVSLDLTSGGGLDGAIPSGWEAYDEGGKGYKKNYDIGTKVEDITNIWKSQHLKRYEYEFDKSFDIEAFIDGEWKSYKDEIIQENVSALKLYPKWNELPAVTLKGLIQDADGIPLTDDNYQVWYLDVTGATKKADVTRTSSPAAATFEIVLPASSSGVIKFVDTNVGQGKRISQDITVSNVTDDSENVGTLVVEYRVTVTGSISNIDKPSEIYPDSTIVLYSYEEEEGGRIKQEVFAGATGEDGKYSIDVKSNRDYFVSAEWYGKDGSVVYSTSSSVSVRRNDAVCDLQFSDTKYLVSVDLGAGVLKESLIPSGYTNLGNIYGKQYCMGTNVMSIKNMWSSLPIEYDGEVEPFPTITLWSILPTNNNNLLMGNTRITANWNDSVVVSGRVQNTFGQFLGGAKVTMTLSGEEDPLTTTTDENGNYSFADVPLGSSGSVSVEYEKNGVVQRAADKFFSEVVSNSNLGISFIEQTVAIFGTIGYKDGRKYANQDFEIFTSRVENGVVKRESYYTKTDGDGKYRCEVAHQHTYVIQLELDGDIWYSGDIPVDTVDVPQDIALSNDNVVITIDLNGGYLNKSFDESWKKAYDEHGQPIYRRKCTKGSTTVNSIKDQWNIAGISAPQNDGKEQVLSGWELNPLPVEGENPTIDKDTIFTAQYTELNPDVQVSFTAANTAQGQVYYSGPKLIPSASTYKILSGGQIRITYIDNMTTLDVFTAPGNKNGVYYEYWKWVRVMGDGSEEELTGNSGKIETIDGASDFKLKAYFKLIPPIEGTTFNIDPSEATGCSLSWTMNDESATGAPVELSYGTNYSVDGSALTLNDKGTIWKATAVAEATSEYMFSGWKIAASGQGDKSVVTSGTLTKPQHFYACFVERTHLIVNYSLEHEFSHGYFEAWNTSGEHEYTTSFSDHAVPGAGAEHFYTIKALGDDYDNDGFDFKLYRWTYNIIDPEGGTIETGEIKEVETLNPITALEAKGIVASTLGGHTVNFVAHMAAPTAVYDKTYLTMTFTYEDFATYNEDSNYFFYHVDKDCSVDLEDTKDSKFADWLYPGDGTPKVWPYVVRFDASFKDVHGIESTAGWFMNTSEDFGDESLDRGGQSRSNQSNQSDLSPRSRKIIKIEGWENFDAKDLIDTSYMFASWNVFDVAFTDFSFINQYWAPAKQQAGAQPIQKADYMFCGTYCAEEINFPPKFFNEASVKHMFHRCKALKSITLDVGFGGSKDSISFDYLFYLCSSLERVEISGSSVNPNKEIFFGEHVQTCRYMFAECYNLTSITSTDGGPIYFGHDCEDYSHAFAYCYNLAKFDLKLETYCTLEKLEIGTYEYWWIRDLDVCALCTDCMFMNCSKLTSLDLSSFTILNSTRLPQWWHDYEMWDINKGKRPSYSDMLRGANLLSEIKISPKTFKGFFATENDYTNLSQLGLYESDWIYNIYNDATWVLDYRNVKHVGGDDYGLLEEQKYFDPYNISLRELYDRGFIWREYEDGYRTGDTEVLTFRRQGAFAIVDNDKATMTFKYFDDEYFKEHESIELPENGELYRVKNTYKPGGIRQNSVPTWYSYNEDRANGGWVYTNKLTKCDSYEVIFDPSFYNYKPTGMALWFSSDQTGRQPYRFTKNTHFENIDTTYVKTVNGMFGSFSSESAESNESRYDGQLMGWNEWRQIVSRVQDNNLENSDSESMELLNENNAAPKLSSTNSSDNSSNSKFFNNEIQTNGIKEIDISRLGIMSNYTGMFAGATSLEKVTLPNNFSPGYRYIETDDWRGMAYTEYVSFMDMFADCSNLEQIINLDSTYFYTIALDSSITATVKVYTSRMFRNCSSLRAVDLRWVWEPGEWYTDTGDWVYGVEGTPRFPHLPWGRYDKEYLVDMLSGCNMLQDITVGGKLSYNGYCEQLGQTSWWSEDIGQVNIGWIFDLPDTYNFDECDYTGSWTRKYKVEDPKRSDELFIGHDECDPTNPGQAITFHREDPTYKSIEIDVDGEEYGSVDINEYRAYDRAFYYQPNNTFDSIGLAYRDSMDWYMGNSRDYDNHVSATPKDGGRFDYWTITTKTIDGAETTELITANVFNTSQGYESMDLDNYSEIKFTAHFSDANKTAKAVWTTDECLKFYYDSESHLEDEGVIEVYDVPVNSHIYSASLGGSGSQQQQQMKLESSLEAHQSSSAVSSGSTLYSLDLPPWYELVGMTDMPDSNALDYIVEGLLGLGSDGLLRQQAASGSNSNDVYDLSLQYIKVKPSSAHTVIFNSSFKDFKQLFSISGWFMADSFGDQPFANFVSVDDNGNKVENMSSLPTDNVNLYYHAFGGYMNIADIYQSSTQIGDAVSYGTSIQSVDFSKNTFSKHVVLNGMFANCNALTNVKFPATANESKLFGSLYVFANCESLQSIKDSNFDKFISADFENQNNSVVRASLNPMHGLFFGCSSLEELDLRNIYVNFGEWRCMFTDCYSLKEITVADSEEDLKCWYGNFGYSGLQDIQKPDGEFYTWTNDKYRDERFYASDFPYSDQYWGGTFTRGLPAKKNLNVSVDEGSKGLGVVNGAASEDYKFTSNARIRIDKDNLNVLWVDNRKMVATPVSNEYKFKYWKFYAGFGDMNDSVIQTDYDEVIDEIIGPDGLKIVAVFGKANSKVQVEFTVDTLSEIGFFTFKHDEDANLDNSFAASSLGDSSIKYINTYEVDDNCTVDNLPSWYYTKTETWFKEETHDIPAFKKEIEKNCRTIQVKFDESMKDYDGLRSMSCWFMPAISNSDQTKLYNPFVNSNKELTIDFENLNQDNISNVSNMFGGYEYFSDKHGSDVQKITLKNFDPYNKRTSMRGMFKNCVDLQRVEFDEETCGLKNVTNLSYLFANCPSFISYGNAGNQTFTLQQLFKDHNNIENISYMFSGLFDNNTRTDTQYYVYLDCNTKKVNNMEGLFANNSHTPYINIYVGYDFDTRNVKNMSCMFMNCYNCEQIYVRSLSNQKVNDGSGRYFSTANVENFSKMFYNCDALESLEGAFDDSDNITFWHSLAFDNAKDLSWMFAYTRLTSAELKSDNVENSATLSNVTNMFYNSFISYVDFGCAVIDRVQTIGYSKMFSANASSRDGVGLTGRDGKYSGLSKVNFGQFWNTNLTLFDLGVSIYYGVPEDYDDTAKWFYNDDQLSSMFKYYYCDQLPYKYYDDESGDEKTLLGTYEVSIRSFYILGRPCIAEIENAETHESVTIDLDWSNLFWRVSSDVVNIKISNTYASEDIEDYRDREVSSCYVTYIYRDERQETYNLKCRRTWDSYYAQSRGERAFLNYSQGRRYSRGDENLTGAITWCFSTFDYYDSNTYTSNQFYLNLFW